DSCSAVLVRRCYIKKLPDPGRREMDLPLDRRPGTIWCLGVGALPGDTVWSQALPAMTLRLLGLVGWARRSGGCWLRTDIVSPWWPVVRGWVLSGPLPSSAQGSQRRMTRPLLRLSRLAVVSCASRHQMMSLP